MVTVRHALAGLCLVPAIDFEPIREDFGMEQVQSERRVRCTEPMLMALGQSEQDQSENSNANG